LPPTERLAELGRKAVLIGARKGDPASELLRKEFDARFTSWLIVLDGRGELLESGFADRAGDFKKKETAEKCAGPFLDRVERSLERKMTLQNLERRWKRDPAAESAFTELVERYEEMAAYARLREFCEKVASLPGLPAGRRADAQLRAFVTRPREMDSVVGTPEGKEQYIVEGEGLIAEHASHPRCSDAVQALFMGGYSGRFDVPSRTAAGVARLEAIARGLKEPDPLRNRIAELTRLCDAEMAKLRGAPKGDPASEGWAAAMLGDAETTVRLLSQPPVANSPFYQALVKEAQEKLRQRK